LNSYAVQLGRSAAATLSGVTMTWLRALTTHQALIAAAGWPLALLVIPSAIVAGAWLYTRWLTERSVDSVYFIKLRVASWPILLALAFLPPVAFLALWRISHH
jgi:hypothetical protein